MPLNIVLVEPEIPQNTGNIARTCAATGTSLHLIRPLGFSVDDKYLKRAGLDYWHMLDVFYYDGFGEYVERNPDTQIVLFTKKARFPYTGFRYDSGASLVFGRETAGLPDSIRKAYPESCVRIPMVADARSLNLSNAAAVAVYEAMRQQDFPGLTHEPQG